jgi:hypothetical protein
MKPLLTVSVLLAVSGVFADEISFNRDIRPLMSDTCFHCHGFDAKTREAGLRLDLRNEAVKKTEEGVLPIVPGDPDRSEIILRIFDEEDPMPPEKAHKPFSPEQKELFRRWVAEGAKYEPHWAYAPLKRPTLPSGKETLNPIDAFVLAKLEGKGIQPSLEAPAYQLRRRLHLDLVGLPPAGEAAQGEFNYDAEVEGLLSSPHFGERFAVWWLDIARYADTVGFHGDQNQRIFPYRDYVIEAFNSNKRFDQFTREQLAGDLLPNPTAEQLTATGYNRLNMMTREGGAQPKEYLSKYGAERVRSVAAAWFGSTFGCAECHDHKFDPIKTRDFYELQSFFADVKQWGVYANYGYTPEPELEGVNNDSPFPPEIEVVSPWMKRRSDEIRNKLESQLSAAVEKLSTDEAARQSQEKWEQSLGTFLKSHPDGWLAPSLVSGEIQKDGKAIPKRAVKLDPTGTVQTDKALGKGESVSIVTDPAGLTALASVKIRIETAGMDAAKLPTLPGKSLVPAFTIRDATGKTKKLSVLAADATAKRPLYRGGSEVPGIAGEWRLPKTLPEGMPLESVWLIKDPVALAAGDQVVVSISGDNTLPLRVSLSPLAALEPLDTAKGIASLSIPAEKRTPAQIREAGESFLFSTIHDRAAYDQSHQFATQLQELNQGKAWTMVTESVSNPLTVRVLPRGNWQDETGPVVLPSTPSFLPGRIESTEGKRLTRLDLANWIVSDANPITARAVMNRLWAEFFGIGLSAAVDDLGSQGEWPSHPELIDWLASEFRDSGWDMKHMIRLIVTSKTYRQNSSLRPELKDIDPANRLLASQNPRRLRAEFVRDNALAISGLLNLQDIGGPSVKPYQPAGYYEALQFPSRDYVADTDERQWRRGVYTHWQRTFLHPMMANFDAPARDECAAARTDSNTPQQALTLLNDPAFVEAARVFAARILQDSASKENRARLAFAYQTALNREPKEKEVTSLLAFLEEQQKYFTANPDEATKLIQVGIAPGASLAPVEHAVWTQLARVLLNTHETITRC